MRIAQHIDQRTLAHHHAEQIRALHHGRGHQQAAVRCTHAADLRWRNKATPRDIGRHRFEIVIGALAVHLERGVVPFGAEFPAAADVGNGDGAAFGEPCLSGVEWPMAVVPVPGLKREFEAAVGIKNCRLRAMGVLPVNKEVGNLRSVRGNGLELIRNEAVRIKTRGFGFDRVRRARAVVRIERYRLQKTFEGEIGLWRPGVGIHNVSRAALRQVELRITPCAGFVAFECVNGTRDVFENRRVNSVAAGRHVFDRAACIRREQNRIGRLCILVHEILNVERGKGSLGDGIAGRRRPILARGEDQFTAGHAFQIGAKRQWQLPRRTAFVHRIEFRGKEGNAAFDDRDCAVGTVEHDRPRGNIGRLCFVDGFRGGNRFPAVPELHDARIARFGHRTGPEIRSKQDSVVVEIGHVGFGNG